MSTSVSTSDESGTLRCARHPNTETVLRCGRCDTPICARCMIMSPVGARCPTCAQVKRFALLLKPIEVARAVGFGLAVAAVGTVILLTVPILGGLIGPLFGFGIVGFAVGEAVSRGANRKRVPALAPIAVACLCVGVWLGVILLNLGSGAGFSLALLLAPLVLLRNTLFLVGIGVGALLAWMRTR
jgi:hypothetical protein